MELFIVYWYWLTLGVFFLILELLSPGAFMLWLSGASFITSFLVYILDPIHSTWQLTIFSVLALFSLLLWKKFSKKYTKNLVDPGINDRAQRYIGKTTFLVEDIKNGQGYVNIDDTLWSVRCSSSLLKGDMVHIIEKEGMAFIVEPASNGKEEKNDEQ